MFLKEVYEAILEEPKSDPRTYEEPVNDVDANQWVKSMETELKSMYSNQVWELVEALDRIKPIGCKWVNKRKIWVGVKVETFKTRIVTKGFT